MPKVKVAEVENAGIVDVDDKPESDRIRASVLSALFGKDGGVVGIFNNGVFVDDNLAVKPQGTPDMTVDVLDGICGFPNGHALGNNLITGAAKATVNIDASDASLARVDLITLRTDLDSASGLKVTGGDIKQGNAIYTAGTPAISPVSPAVPQDDLCRAKITVGPGVASITAIDIFDCRAFIRPLPELAKNQDDLFLLVNQIDVDLNDVVNLLATLTLDFTNQLDDLKTTVGILTDADSAIQAQIDAIKASLDTIDVSLFDVQLNTTTIVNRLSPTGDIGGALIDLDGRLDTVEIELTALGIDVTQAQTDRGIIEATLDSILLTLVQKCAEILILQNTAADFEIRISALEAAPGAPTDLDDRVESIEDTLAGPDPISDIVRAGDVDAGASSNFEVLGNTKFQLSAGAGSPLSQADSFTHPDGTVAFPPPGGLWTGGGLISRGLAGYRILSNQIRARGGPTVLRTFDGTVGAGLPAPVGTGAKFTVDLISGPEVSWGGFMALWIRDLVTGKFNLISYSILGGSGGPGISMHWQHFNGVSVSTLATDLFNLQLPALPPVLNQNARPWTDGTDPIHWEFEIIGITGRIRAWDDDGAGNRNNLLADVTKNVFPVDLAGPNAESAMQIGIHSNTVAAGDTVYDNALIEQLGISGGFDSPGVVKTALGALNGVDPIRFMRVNGDIDIPANTVLSLNVSPDGGANWVSGVTPGDYNNVSGGLFDLANNNDPLVQLDMSTSDSDVTPSADNLTITTTELATGAEASSIKTKQTELINQYNQLLADFNTAIDPDSTANTVTPL